MAKQNAIELTHELSNDIMIEAQFMLREINNSQHATRIHSYGLEIIDGRPTIKLNIDERATVTERRYLDSFNGKSFKYKSGKTQFDVPVVVTYSKARQAW